jgi:hypothetical protein
MRDPGTNGVPAFTKETAVLTRVVLMIVLAAAVLAPLPSQAQGGGGPGWYEGPYGRSCPGYHGGPYGSRIVIKTADEAKQAIEKYFAGSPQPVQVTIVAERRRFYVAEITEPAGPLIDKIIIDKRSGRIRSIY